MISIIIPTYNEAGNIVKVITRIRAVLVGVDYEILVMDDDSPDKTWKIVQSLDSKYHATVIRRTGQKDLASAVIEGIAQAKGDIIGIMDGDLSHPPRYLSRMVKMVEQGSDLVIGSRLVKGGDVQEWPMHRKFISWVGRMFAWPLTDVKDIMSGFLFFRRAVIRDVDLTAKGYKIGLEIIVKGSYKKKSEIPFVFENRKVGKSKIGVVTYYRYLIQILRLYQYRLSRIFRIFS